MTAVKAGYRMLDCANDYDNEHVIGEALKELFAAGVVKREELFVQVYLSSVSLLRISLWQVFLLHCLIGVSRQSCGTQTTGLSM